MSTRQRLATALFVAVLAYFACHYAAPSLGDFLAEHGWASETGAGELVIVEDADKPTPESGAVNVSPKVRDAAAAKSISFRVVHPNDTGPDMPKVQWAIDVAAGKTLPVYCFRRGGGRAKVWPLPGPDKMAEAIGKL